MLAVWADGTVPSVDELIWAPVSELGATFDAVTAPRRSLDVVTAPLFSCLVPTLFFGRLRAAYALPPSEMNSAASATSMAGEGR